MLRLDVALLAESGRAGLQQLRTGGTMRFMAVHAIFHHRGMLPQERAAPLRMALVTGLINCARNEQAGIGSSMRVMAIGAGDLSFPKRHVRRALHLSAAQLVALKADLHPRLLDELTIPRQRLIKTEGRNIRLHDLVTRDAGQAARFVRASLPKHPRAFFMALQTRVILFLGRETRFLPETHNGGYIPSPLRMRASGSMTGLTSSRFQWGFGVVQECPAHGGILPALQAGCMAGSAHLASHVLGIVSRLRNLRRASGFAFHVAAHKNDARES
jgi:hypothetical protein